MQSGGGRVDGAQFPGSGICASALDRSGNPLLLSLAHWFTGSRHAEKQSVLESCSGVKRGIFPCGDTSIPVPFPALSTFEQSC